jgi:hypothetical protein
LGLPVNGEYEFTLTAESTINGIAKSGTATVYVHVTAAMDLNMSVSILSSEGVYSAQTDLIINSLVDSDASGGATATWTLQSAAAAAIDLTSSAVVLAPTTRPFSFGELSSGLNFPLGIRSDVLTPGVPYIFRLTVEDSLGNAIFNEVTISPNSPPVGGTFAVTPSSGFAFITEFDFAAFNWGDSVEDYPIEYLFVYQDASSFDAAANYDQVSLRDSIATTSSLLPEGVTTVSSTVACAVFISDYWGATSTAETSVSVTEGDLLSVYGSIITRRRHLEGLAPEVTARSLLSAEVNTYIIDDILPYYLDVFTEANDALQIETLQSSLLVSANLLAAVDSTNCSWSPDCASLNRNDCSAVSHTCGECLPGFEGAFGDSNSLCQHSSSAELLPSGAACVDGVDECVYGNCEASTCQAPVKTCPLGPVNGLECSGQGACAYAGYQSDVLQDECREDNAFCTAACACEPGFAGRDCSVEDAQMTKLDTTRGSLCANLRIYMDHLDSSSDKVSASANLLTKMFAYDEVIVSSSMIQCVSVLSRLDSTVLDLANTDISAPTRESVVSIMSDFVQSALYSSASAELESLVAHLGDNILNGMVQGQDSVDLVSDNLRLSYRYELLSLLSGTSVSVPQSAEEAHYGSPVATVDLPAAGLDSCANFEDYGKLAVASWGLSPFTRDPSLASTWFSVATVATSALSSSESSSADVSSYQLTLPVVQEQNWTAQEPNCQQFSTVDGGTLVDCNHCNVSSYDEATVTFACTDSATLFCPTDNSLASASSSYYVVESADRATPEGLSNFDDLVTKQSTGALSFIAVVFFILFVGIALLYRWDERDRTRFIYERNEQKKAGPYRFDLTAAFDERGVSAQRVECVSSESSVSDSSSDEDEALQIDDGKAEVLEIANGNENMVVVSSQQGGLQEDNVVLHFDDEASSGSSGSDSSSSDGNYSLAAYDFPLTSLLSYGLFWDRLWTAIKRHHKWVRIFTFPSIQKTRVTRLLVAGTDLLFLLFAVTLFYGVFYPDDNECEKLRTEEDCVDLQSRYKDQSQCSWSEEDGCELDAPAVTMQSLAMACSLIIVVTVLPRRLLQMLLEKVCNKRPILEDIGKSSKTSLKPEPAVFGTCHEDFTEHEPDDLTKRYADEAWVDSEQGTTDFTANTNTNHVVPYRLGYCDSITAQEELNVIIVSAKELFNATLESAPLPWHMAPEEEHAQDPEVKQLAAMGSIMRWMYLHPDGTPTPLTPLQKLRHGSAVKRMTSKLASVRKSAGWVVEKTTCTESIRPGQIEFQDNILVQHFITEQISPICRFGISKGFYQQDNSSCGRIPFWYWFAAWVVIVVAWCGMAAWCFVWAASNGSASVASWAVTFAVLFAVDNVLNEMCQIYFLNVLVTDKLRPQLQQIYDVLARVLETRWSDEYFAGGDIRVIQHLSASCRASRVPSLSGLAASKMLGLLDDKDIALCRNKRLTSFKDIGFFCYLTLAIPARIHDANEIVQKTFLDLIFPVFWMFFFLLNYLMYSVSIGLLIGFYVLSLVLIFYFTHLVKQDWWKEYIGSVVDSVQDNLEIDVNKMGGGISQQESSWDKMNNVVADEYELTGFNFDMVEYDEGLAKQNFTFPQFSCHFARVKRKIRSPSWC